MKDIFAAIDFTQIDDQELIELHDDICTELDSRIQDDYEGEEHLSGFDLDHTFSNNFNCRCSIDPMVIDSGIEISRSIINIENVTINYHG